ncbi:hypothetical protein VI03_16790 [Burkholderia vietnamiensis]|uniref:hypothetical protein n=1 Tax=Burkholderia vietnamiensis TaxID=60552 RepID=UPI000621EBDD|nr:hypothetical protein [Burkholderia vietnamiensis]KKI37657.1 hypothetical protein VI03_16790 [Burkholderia vietnamiensis]
MNRLLVFPFELINQGGLSAVVGCLFFAIGLLLIFIVFKISLGLLNFSVMSSTTKKGRITRKFVVPEHTEQQGRLLVKVPARNMLEVDVEGELFVIGPPDWKYERVSEGDEVEVLLRIGRLTRAEVLDDIGSF